MANDPKKNDKKAGKGVDPQEILAGFQTLRADQQKLSSKLSELELDQNEHKIVIETLKNVNEDRKCFRLVGGILTERKVKDVLPVLQSNSEKLGEIIEKLSEQITKKGQELNEYKEKYNIRFRGLDNPKEDAEPRNPEGGESSRGNVLVS
ncbi:prefoldin subunit 2 [Anthonomus grandis grandis]|uniref:prefoldin subunit 2 n=1 Tax=Anthonomus grandis grandis TaxID=2921223 RepID=UPI0021666E8B|nr:prefoldin subunit 2 [Anthonomus grandis grandis]